MEPLRFIENRIFDEIAVGDTASLTRTLQAQNISLFALASVDVKPTHLDRDYAATDRFHGVIAHGLWTGSLISAALGTELPGRGTIYLSQTLQFLHPVGIGDAVTARITVRERGLRTEMPTIFAPSAGSSSLGPSSYPRAVPRSPSPDQQP